MDALFSLQFLTCLSSRINIKYLINQILLSQLFLILRSFASMIPKFQLSIYDVRPSNQKRVRSPDKANIGIPNTNAIGKAYEGRESYQEIPCDLDDKSDGIEFLWNYESNFQQIRNGKPLK